MLGFGRTGAFGRGRGGGRIERMRSLMRSSRMTDQRYLTVGELARRVGVTVRTIQYYDQQGLLSPSAKGPQNQRLYTDDNVKD
ncbi:MAG: MerR family DNA-binding transcriptional regulator, partial [Gordonibacter urolithinfaciens]